MSVPTHLPPRCRSCSQVLTPPGHICASCGTTQSVMPQPYVQTNRPAKSAGVAVLLSFFWFGAGHLYVNRTGAAVPLIVFDGFLVLLAITGIGLLIAVPIWIVSAPFVMLTAASAANSYNRRNGLVAG